MNKRNVVKLREYSAEDIKEQGPENFILGFYKDLGWNPETEILDPTKVRISESTYNNLGERLKESVEESEFLGQNPLLLWMNYGPGVDRDLSFNEVRLLDEWHTLES